MGNRWKIIIVLGIIIGVIVVAKTVERDIDESPSGRQQRSGPPASIGSEGELASAKSNSQSPNRRSDPFRTTPSKDNPQLNNPQNHNPSTNVASHDPSGQGSELPADVNVPFTQFPARPVPMTTDGGGGVTSAIERGGNSPGSGLSGTTMTDPPKTPTFTQEPRGGAAAEIAKKDNDDPQPESGGSEEKQTPPPATTVKTHEVGEGENLWEIARLYYGRGELFPKIVDANPSLRGDPDSVRAGIKLRIPVLSADETKKRTRTLPPAPTGFVRYTIQDGDTFYAIARDRLGSVERVDEIIDANPGLDPRDLREGKSILIPAK